MDFELTDDQKKRREEIIAFAQAELNKDLGARDREKMFSREIWRKLGAQGLLGLPVPEELGGGGLDPLSTVLAFEAFGYGCEDAGLAFAAGAHGLAVANPIAKFGTDEQKKAIVPKLADGTWVGAIAMTEPNAGSDMGGIETTAVRDGDDYVINGSKTLITNSPEADVAIIFAITDAAKGAQGGITGFLVPRETAGYEAGPTFDMMGHRTAPCGAIELKGVRVPASAILGGREGAGVGVFQHAMNWERIGLFASHSGAMARLLEKTIAFARTRKQGGQAIGKYQAVSHKIVDMKLRLETSRLLALQSASRLDRSREVAMDASMTKLFVSEAYAASARDAMQVFGGSGYLTETGVERIFRDAAGTTLYSGTSEVQRNIIAAWLGL